MDGMTSHQMLVTHYLMKLNSKLVVNVLINTLVTGLTVWSDLTEVNNWCV